ncbi:MAG: helix-turn-helix transcriptional regulator [Roseburia sp.]|nr:helix-turn-helix transcriptional regulator [Roseburia sp.]
MTKSRTTIDMKETGKHLKKLAQRSGYSVKDIQQYLNLSCPQPVYRWYKGDILPSVDNLLRLSELYQVHMEELLVKNKYILNYDTEKINFEKRIRAYYFKLVA